MKNPDSDRPSLDEWDDHFRQRFADFQSEPPADALQRILADLATSAPAPPPQSTGSRTNWWLGGAALLLLLTGTVWVTQYESTKEELTRGLAQYRQEKPEHNTITRKQQEATTAQPVGQSTESARLEQTLTQAESSVEDRILTETAPVATNLNRANTTPVASKRNQTEQPLTSTSEKAAASSKLANPALGRPVATAVGTASEKVPSPFVSPVTEVARTSKQAQKQESSWAGKQSEQTQQLSVNHSGVSPAEQFPKSSSGNLLAGDQVVQAVVFAYLSNHPMQSLRVRLDLPDVTTAALPPATVPKTPTVQRQRPILYGSVMPLYTYQRINPIQDDAVWVKSVTTQKALSTQRAGVRLQAGVEWPLGRRMALRTSLAYNQLTQQLTYTLPSTQPDSVVVERINAQTIRLTPYYNDQRVSTRTNWHYVGLGADLVWQLGKLGGWQHYLTTGASAGTYLNGKSFMPNGPLSGFVQGSYGLERPLTPTLWLRVAPTVQYGLSAVSDETGLFQVRPYTYGLTIGLRR